MKRKLKYFLLILSIFYLLIYVCNFSTIFDEDYSLVMIHHSYFNIIKYTGLDVHPPLFYLVYKLFLSVTTFWITSLLIKILFARIFFVIISLITFCLLIKIVHICDVRINSVIEFIFFLLVPGVISFTYEFIKIRMYTLAAMFVIAEVYELIRYSSNDKLFNLITATILAILALYTNYYAGFISGLFLLLCLIKYLIESNKKYIDIFWSILFMAISFIPWLPVLFHQFALQSYHPLPPGVFKQWIATFCMILLFVYPLVWSLRHLKARFNNIFLNTSIILFILFIFMSIVSVIYRPVFQFRYFYPVFLIYGFLGINALYIIIKLNNNNIKQYFSYLIILILSFVCVGAYVDQVKYFNMSAIPMVKSFYHWKINDKKEIYIKPVNNDDDGFDDEKVIYLNSIGKDAKSPNIKKGFTSNPSYKGMFKNIDDHLEN